MAEVVRVLFVLFDNAHKLEEIVIRKGATNTLVLYRTRFIGHKFELSGLVHAGLLPSEPRLARAA